MLGHRQPDGEARALAELARDLDASAVRARDLARERQAEPEAGATLLPAATLEAREDLGQLVRRDARTVVRNGHADLGAGPLRLDSDAIARVAVFDRIVH